MRMLTSFILGTVGCIALYIFGQNVFCNNKPNNSSPKSAEASSVASKPTISSTDAFQRTSENSHKSSHQKPKDLPASSASVKSNPVVNSPVPKPNNSSPKSAEASSVASKPTISSTDAFQRTSENSHKSSHQKPKDLPASSASVKSNPVVNSPVPKPNNSSLKSAEASSVASKPTISSTDAFQGTSENSHKSSHQKPKDLPASSASVKSNPVVNSPVPKPNNSSPKSVEASSVASKPTISSTDAFQRTSENSHKSSHQKPKDLHASSASVKSNPVVNSPVPKPNNSSPKSIEASSVASKPTTSSTNAFQKTSENSHKSSHQKPKDLPTSSALVKSNLVVNSPVPKPNNSSPKSVEASSVASKPTISSTDAFQRTSENSHKSSHHKPKDLPASSASVKSNPVLSKKKEKKKSNPVVDSPVLSSVVDKSSSISQKPTDLPSNIAPNYYSQSKDVSSASSQASDSLPKLAASSNSSRPSIYVSEHPASTPANYGKKVGHNCVQKGASPTSSCPESSNNLIGKDVSASSSYPRPSVSKHPLSSSSTTNSLPHLSPNPASPTPKLPHPLSMKPTISLASSKPASDGEKVDYIYVDKGASPTYLCPEDFKSLIEKDIVPRVLENPLSKSTYKEYFQALLYAEDCYLEKWEGFEMNNVTLQLHEAAIHTRRSESKILNDVKDAEKTFVAFEMDKIPERQPFLLSRDFVTVRPLTKKNKNKTFQGIIYRVERFSNFVLAEFGEDFYSQHDPSSTYDIKFSFNRVCLKRAHQAIKDASDDLLKNVLFPNFTAGNKLHTAEPSFNHNVGGKESRAGRQILTLQGSPTYLVEGPLCLSGSNQLSETGVFVVKTVLKFCQASSSNRILLCAPTNKICDMFTRGLKKVIPESDMFRANAAFRELDGVPIDILPSCLYKTEQECFSCPSLGKLCKFKVILSTFMSSFQLHNQGIMAGHFTHIFLVDASTVTEPETLVPLSNFANDRTAIIVTGEQGNRSTWIRSTIARQNGLRISYFERVWNSRLHENCDP